MYGGKQCRGGIFYKRNNATCTNTGWTCIARTFTAGEPLGAFNWNAGDTIFLLLNAESVATVVQSFQISCATNICDNITSITCGNPVQFNSSGYGNPSYPNGMNGQGCNSGTAQGGQEAIFRFVVPATGTYQISCTAENNSAVEYFYKRNNATCTNTGWACIARTFTAGEPLGAFNWTVGDTIFLLLNAESAGVVSQSFQINCARRICDVVTPITCGNTVQFNSAGYGDPLYPNGMNGQGCNSGTAQGGQEALFRFVVPASGTYQITCTAENNTAVEYFYKRNNTACTNTGWLCLARTFTAGEALGAVNWTVGDTILFLLNAESAGTVSQSFRISCATNVCDAIQTINYRDTVQFSSLGYGDPLYPNGINGQGCNSGTAQGGQEKIYRFAVPVTGIYRITCIVENNTAVEYFYKRNNNTCSNTGWTCIGRTFTGGESIGSVNWTAGDIITLLLNAESTGTVLQSFKINTDTVLPLKLSSFDITSLGKENKLSWTTASETNTDYFIVEHCANGIDFNDLTKISAVNNSSVTKTYQFSDNYIITGLNYYRLKMVNIDGTFTYSKIILIDNKRKSAVKIFPNPAKDNLQIQLTYSSVKDVNIQITDLQGRVIKLLKKHLSSGISVIHVDVSSLIPGTYLLTINGENIKKMFIKE